MKKIKLTRGKYALVNSKDFDWLNQYRWFYDDRKAVRSMWNSETKKKSNLSMHRFITEAFKSEVVDHINHNPLDNRRKNLRLCDRKQNQGNRLITKGKMYKGVGARGKKFRAYIMIDGKHFHIGYFEEAKEAAMAYNEEAKRIFGEFAYLNKVNGK